MQNDPYQKVANVLLGDVVQRVSVPRPVPDIFLIVAPCRSGTTAQAKVFRAAGILSHHQPLKSILRCLLQQQEERYTIPAVPRLLIRETLGPYTTQEATFDPVTVLLEAGIPREKLHVVFMLREPLSTLTSWQEFFSFKRSAEVLLSNFIYAHRTMRQMSEKARARGLLALHYVYEALRDNAPALINEKLFAQLGIEISYGSIDWRKLAPFASTDEHPSIPTEPRIYTMQHLQKVRDRESDARPVEYSGKSIAAIDRAISSQQVARLINEGISDIYEEQRKATEHDLQISIGISQEISDYQRRHDRGAIH